MLKVREWGGGIDTAADHSDLPSSHSSMSQAVVQVYGAAQGLPPILTDSLLWAVASLSSRLQNSLCLLP